VVDGAKSKRCEKVEVEDGDEAIAQMIPYQAGQTVIRFLADFESSVPEEVARMCSFRNGSASVLGSGATQ
jgi:hypothetical protein